MSEGRTVLVTGAGRGIGRAIADHLHELGHTVYGTSRHPDGARSIAERYGTTPVCLDVTDAAAPAALFASFAGTGIRIDALVNNAGVNVPQPALDVDPEAWDHVYDTNVRGLFFVSQAAARDWRDRRVGGAIVNIGSQAGTVAIEDRAAYGSSKAAVAGLTRNLAFEWGPLGIRVNTVAPTFIRTELTESTLADVDVASRLEARIPLGRFGRPEDVVGAVAFLLSGAASMITGQTLLVDGGYTIH